MESLVMQVKPTWAAGVDLRQTMVDCIQVVGDVESPLALRGAGVNTIGWLEQLDGSRSWGAQLAEAQARGIEHDQARAVLSQLFEAGLLVDAPDIAAVSVLAAPLVLGSRDIGERVASLVVDARYVGVIPKPRDGMGWQVDAERLIDEVVGASVVVVLDAPWVDAAEFEVLSRLIDQRLNHLVVGAGVNTVRIGPMTIDGCGPCARCDEMFRLDLDPSWRTLSAQLALDAPPERSAVLSSLAAAEAARQVESAVPGAQAASLNGVLRAGRAGSAWTRRRLPRHARCSCWWASVNAAESG
ncbi:MAG: hypothetical protein WC054_14185 [Candidatus Nanopelagicales bacterium]